MNPTLELDKTSVKPEALSRETLMRELNLKKRPAWIFRKFMNALETKRSTRGFGWSRPWNRYGLNVFRTHVHDLAIDAPYLISIKDAIDPIIASLPFDYKIFSENLWSDPNLQAFSFYHNNRDEWGEFEGLTISIGREVASDPSKRDRLDIILEDKRENGRVDGIVDRIRIYVNPWSEFEHRSYQLLELQSPWNIGYAFDIQPLYNASVDLYELWKRDESRQWAHWSVRYIESFGPRSFIPEGSSFL